MCWDVFHVLTEYVLYLIYHLALNARNVGDDRTGGDKMLMLLDPIYKRLGVQRKNYKLCLTNKLGLNLGRSVADHTVLNSVTYVRNFLGNTLYLIALLAKCLCIATAHNAKTDYKYFCFLSQFHIP